MMDTVALDATKKYCTRDIVFFWQPPSYFSQWMPSRFTVEGVFIPAVNSFSLRKRAAYLGTTRRHNTSCVCPTLAFISNMEQKSITSISTCGNASEKILCVSTLTPSSPKIQPCNHTSWTRATGFWRKLALTTSYGASDTGLTTSLHASRLYGAA